MTHTIGSIRNTCTHDIHRLCARTAKTVYQTCNAAMYGFHETCANIVNAGKMFVTKIHNLSKEDQAESLTIEDLKVGAGLLCDVKGKMYPVEVLEFKGQYIWDRCKGT